MPPSILITQCLQNDFVEPLGAHEGLPNRLHVGHAEARRLVGDDPRAGPVAELMRWARAQPADAIELVHIRDWHDRDDPRQRDHLAMFGEHCIRGTRGADLVFGIEERPNEQVVDSIALNDFEETSLEARLRAILARSPEPPRVAVVGVWTEAKVSFLLYDLKTRLGLDRLATSSALTASASRAQHFNALEQLSRILGVRALESVADLVAWLSPGSALPPAPAFGPRVEALSGPALGDADRAIVGSLFRDAKSIELEPLAGGFSGALVFKARSRDALGQERAPSVVKIGPGRDIARERIAFEGVEEVLGNSAPSVRGFVTLGERAGLKYSYASMGAGRVRTLKSLFEAGAPEAAIEAILRRVFEAILGPLYAAARYERLPILEHYEFAAKWAPHVRANVEKIVGPERAAAPTLEFPGGARLPNVAGFYEGFLRDLKPGADFHYVSTVHGDLNAANVLLDDRENVWVIDFFHTGAGHVLKDLAKLENDLLYILTPLASRDELAEAIRLTQALRRVADLGEPLAEAPPEGVAAPALRRAWRCVRTLRAIGGRLCREDRNPFQLSVALLRYAVHTLRFDESSALQKEWALATACGLAADVEATARREAVLRVDWLEDARLGRGRLGLTILPGRRDRGRDLAADLEVLRGLGVARLLCLVTDEELAWAGVPGLGEAARAAGIEWRHAPIGDQRAPSLEAAAALARWALEATDAGRPVVVHCLGGLGRTGTIAACALVARGAGASEAIEAVRRARGPRAVESEEQERFVEAFERARRTG